MPETSERDLPSAVAALHRDYCDRATAMLPILTAASDSIEKQRELTSDVLTALHAHALFRASLPEFLGGAALPPAALAEITRIIAMGDASTAWCLGQAFGCAMSAAFMDTEPAEKVFGPEDAVLAWGAGAQGKAVAKDGGYYVTGAWGFASGSKHATWIGAHCRVFEPDGQLRRGADGQPVFCTALFPRNQVEMSDDWHVLGLCGTRSEGYRIDNQFVEQALTLDRETASECRHPGTLFKIPTTSVYAGVFSGVALGIARGALDDLRLLARTKKPRGASASLRDSAVFQSQLAEMEAQWAAAHSYQQQTLNSTWDNTEKTGALSTEDRIAIRLATTYAIRQATGVVENTYRLAGSTAIFNDKPFARRFRDAYAVSQQVQGRHTHFETVGRHLLGLEVRDIFI